MKPALLITVTLMTALVLTFLAVGTVLPKNSPEAISEKDRFLDVLGSRLRFREVEHQGPALIMLHGFGGDLEVWEPFIGKIDCARLISIDQIGFGLSDRPSITYDLESQRQYLLAFMDRMNIPKAILMGTSMGASVALWTAARSPERVAGLVLFAPSAYPGSMRHRWPGDLIYRPGIANKAMRLVAGSKFYEFLFPRSLARQAMDITASYTGEFPKVVSTVRQPLLLVWSQGDRRVPFAYSNRYRELLPHARFIEASPGVGHNAAQHPSNEIVEGVRNIIAIAQMK